MPRTPLTIVYDGGCPFCSRYVRLLRLRENFDIALIDARTVPDRVAAYAHQGIKIDEGLVVEVGGVLHYGANAVCLLSALSTRAGAWNWIFASLFRHRSVALLFYPAMRLGRRVTLAALGRRRIR